jgi:hypothetical protein
VLAPSLLHGLSPSCPPSASVVDLDLDHDPRVRGTGGAPVKRAVVRDRNGLVLGLPGNGDGDGATMLVTAFDQNNPGRVRRRTSGGRRPRGLVLRPDLTP